MTALRVSCGDGPAGNPTALIRFGLISPVGLPSALTSRSFSDFAVELCQRTGVVRCLCTLTAGLKVTFDLFGVQLFTAVYGNVPQAREVSFWFCAQEAPQVT